MGVEIIKSLDSMPSAITPDMTTKDDASNVLNDLAKLKKMLEAVDKYHEYAKRYISFEARTYVDIANLPGDASKIKASQKKKKVLLAVSRMTAEEKTALIKKCEKECTSIVNVVDQMMIEESRDQASAAAMEQSRSCLIEYERNGRVTLDIVAPHGLKRFEPIFDAVENRTKDRMLRMGAVGIGGGTYVNPDKCGNWHEMESAFEIRARSIRSDILSAYSLITRISKDENWKFSLGSGGYEWIFALNAYFNASERVKERMRETFALMAYGWGPYSYNAPQRYIDEISDAMSLSSDEDFAKWAGGDRA